MGSSHKFVGLTQQGTWIVYLIPDQGKGFEWSSVSTPTTLMRFPNMMSTFQPDA